MRRALWAGLSGEKPEAPRLSLMRTAVNETLKIRILLTAETMKALTVKAEYPRTRTTMIAG